MTNRKSHTRFRLVPKSTLDELGGSFLRILFQITRVFGPMILVSGNIRFTPIFAVLFPGDGASNDSRVVENGNFQYFRSLLLQKL